MVARKTLEQMLKDVLFRHSYAFGEAPTFETQVKLAINDAYAEIIARHEWSQLKHTVEIGLRKGDNSTLFDFEVGEANIPLPFDSVNILSIAVYSPSYRTMQHVTPGELYRRIQSSINALGPPEYLAIVGQTAQYQRNATDSATLTVKSDIVTTNDDQTVRVYYYPKEHLTGGATPWEDVTGNFNTGVALTKTVATGYPVERIMVPPGWVGNLTVENSAATPLEIVRIDPRELPGTSSANANWRVFTRHLARTYPIASADSKAAITYMIDPPPLTENEDVPLIPVAQVLVERATATMWRKKREHELARDHDAIAERILRSLLGATQKVQKALEPYAGNVTAMNGIFW